MSPNFRCALISGASSGIGAATAHALARAGINLVLLARREERLRALAIELMKEYKIEVSYHVADVREAARLAELKVDFSQVDVLINNAGLSQRQRKNAIRGAGGLGCHDRHQRKGLTLLNSFSTPAYGKRGPRSYRQYWLSGRALGLLSGGGVYCASKFAVRAISEGLRHDLLGTPIRVTNIEPGNGRD